MLNLHEVFLLGWVIQGCEHCRMMIIFVIYFALLIFFPLSIYKTNKQNEFKKMGIFFIWRADSLLRSFHSLLTSMEIENVKIIRKKEEKLVFWSIKSYLSNYVFSIVRKETVFPLMLILSGFKLFVLENRT